MSIPSTRVTTHLAVVVAFLVLISCGGTPAPATPEAPKDSLTAAAREVSTDLAKQVGRSRDRVIAVDPFLDKTSGQQTVASSRAQEEVFAALGEAMPNATIEPLKTLGEGGDLLVATGFVGTTTTTNQFVLTVALTDRSSGLVVAQSAARFTDAGLDRSPTPFYGDSPSLVRDRSVDGYIKTADTPKGQLADPLYVEQLPTSALLASALAEYNAGRWEAALAGYAAAAGRPDGQTLRTFNGLYLTNTRLGRQADAEASFGKIVTLGLSTNNLAVKLLFRPGLTEFTADAGFRSSYPMWIRQIARGAAAARACLKVVGHTSASSTDSVNRPLSRRRAETVMQLLLTENPALRSRLTIEGVGSDRVIVGTGADDASDAIDRRVEFEVVACP